MSRRPRVTRRSLLGGLAATCLAGCRRTEEAPAAHGAPPPPEAARVTGDAGPGDGTFVLVGARVFTADPRRPRAEAVFVRDGTVVAVGHHADVVAEAGAAPRIELDGGLVTPGLADAHGHVLGLGTALDQVDLRGARSIDEVVARLRERAPPAGWIQGRGWDQNLWPDEAMPTHAPLTAAFGDRPVYLRRIDGHAAWGNRALLDAAGITKDTPDPPGGEILRDPSGAPTGVLVDAAMDLVSPPLPDDATVRRRIEHAVAHLAGLGITSIHDMGVDARTLAILRALAGAGRLPIRVEVYADADLFERLAAGELPVDPPARSARVRLVGVKLYADGALGSRGAYLLAPYHDRPGHRGLAQIDRKTLTRMATVAMERGIQLATHAIGDAAVRMVLDAYEAALHRTRRKDHRFRIEHAQVVAADDVARFALARVVASMQPVHATSDAPWAPDRLGPDRLPDAYAIARFRKAGVHVCFGSDVPVEHADPRLGLLAAVARTNADGAPPGGFLPDQAIPLDAAIAGFSREAAYAVHRDDHLGTITPGAVADLTCFEKDLFEVAPAEIPRVAVARVFVDGRLVHAA